MTIQVSTVSDVRTTNGKAGDRVAYLTELLSLRPPLDCPAAWLQEIRDRAAARVQELSIPSPKDEEWRFTDLSPLLQTHFQTAQPQLAAISSAEIAPFVLPGPAHRMVFVDGVFAPSLSTEPVISTSLIVGNLDAVQQSSLWDQLPNYLAEQRGADEVFTALNSASLRDGAIAWVSQNQTLETPIHLLFISTKAEQASVNHPRGLVIAEPNSHLTVIEEYVSLEQGVYFTNPVTEIWIETNAAVHHTRIQRDAKESFHIGKTAVSQARDSRYTCNAISYGAQLSRHHLEIYQIGEQTETTLNGLTLIAGEQVADTHSAIAFTKPCGTSRQIHKCIVDDHAHAVFNGKIFVPKPAQLTDAGQVSRTLLLSPKARVDTKPQLEITADNVKCAHGATVSQLESDEIFYLQSRGIDEETARRLLTYAFAYDVIREIPIPSLQDTLAQFVREHF
ncbi:MAG: Fe-S cluster assembly protein SufD [Leptolyngbyaceae cyanobacterium HOT.MB2.61]|jgi:Fe-S cluster assembly protein SufD|nr:Fe-S cluster assembly protein SufD [Leptolyngbyaceae cyanobacterium HOT.MB2.61]